MNSLTWEQRSPINYFKVQFPPQSSLMNPFDPQAIEKSQKLGNLNQERDETMLNLNKMKEEIYRDIQVLYETILEEQSDKEFLNSVISTYNDSFEIMEEPLRKQIKKAQEYEGVLNEDEQAELNTLLDFTKKYPLAYRKYMQACCTPQAYQALKKETVGLVEKIQSKDFLYNTPTPMDNMQYLATTQNLQKKEKNPGDWNRKDDEEMMREVLQQSLIEDQQRKDREAAQKRKEEEDRRKKEAQEQLERERALEQERLRNLELERERQQQEQERARQYQEQERARQHQEQERARQQEQERARQQQEQERARLLQEQERARLQQEQERARQQSELARRQQEQQSHYQPLGSMNSYQQQQQPQQLKLAQASYLAKQPQNPPQLQFDQFQQQNEVAQFLSFNPQSQRSEVNNEFANFQENFEGLSQSSGSLSHFPMRMNNQIVIKNYTGRTVMYRSDQFDILDRFELTEAQKQRFKMATLTHKAALINSPQLQIGCKTELQYVPLREKNYLKLTLYFGNKTDIPIDNSKVRFEGENKGLSMWLQPSAIEERIQGKRQAKQELICIYKQARYRLANLVFSGNFQGRQLLATCFVPTTLVQFADFKEVSAQIFRLKWRQKKGEALKSETFLLNPKIVKTGYHLKKFFPKLCELVAFQQFQEQQLDGVSQYGAQRYTSYKLGSVGGIFELTNVNKNYLIKFIVLPNLQCTIQLVASSTEIGEELLHTFTWLLGLP